VALDTWIETGNSANFGQTLAPSSFRAAKKFRHTPYATPYALRDALFSRPSARDILAASGRLFTARGATSMHVEFRCPHCGAQVSAPDSSAGAGDVCTACGKPLVPLSPGSPEADALRAERLNWPIVLAAVLFPTGLIVLLVCGGLWLPAVWEAGRKAHCMNALQQISIAMLSYQQAYGALPPAYVADKNGRQMHSWRVLLLPYLDCQTLYDAYRFDEPWNGPHNRALANSMPPIYRCPSSHETGASVANYAVVVGPNTVFPGAKTVRMGEITDGVSNTILVVEAARAGINWLEPRDLKEESMNFKINGDPNAEISSFHVAGANASLCDGSVHFLPDSTDPAVLKDLIERNDGHRVDIDQLR
jgi:DNA-directed RNA polymerase subunit RPC12/RpoP